MFYVNDYYNRNKRKGCNTVIHMHWIFSVWVQVCFMDGDNMHCAIKMEGWRWSKIDNICYFLLDTRNHGGNKVFLVLLVLDRHLLTYGIKEEEIVCCWVCWIGGISCSWTAYIYFVAQDLAKLSQEYLVTICKASIWNVHLPHACNVQREALVTCK